MKYITTIGMEIHAQLATQTKMFCACRNASFGEEPNTNICPVCLGLPGALPVANKKAIEFTLDIGADVGANISEFTKWDRKNYFYPDLPKSYQISQFDLPLLLGGAIEFKNDDGTVTHINLTRIHLEEDTAKSIHPDEADYSLIDYNRSSSPLLELVSEPEITNAKDAKKFCETYQLILQRRGVARADMEKGEMRCEANISVRPEGQKEFGTKVEIKNLNSFRSVERAIEYEVSRQIDALERGEKINQETRGWNEAKQKTYVQRKKETAADYRYFPEPDLPPATPGSVWNLSRKMQSALPYPYLIADDLVVNYGVQKQASKIISENPETFAFWTALLVELPNPSDEQKKLLANSIKLYVNMEATKDLSPNQLLELSALLDEGKISQSQAPEIIEYCLQNTTNPQEAIAALGLGSNNDELAQKIDEVLAKNQDAVEKIKAGDQGVIGFLIGQVMGATGGKANPKMVREAILGKLK